MAVTAEDFMRLNDYQYALSLLESVSARLAAGFSLDMSRDEAQAHFDARALLLNHRNRLLNEAEAFYLTKWTRPN